MSRAEETRYSFENVPTRQTKQRAADMVEKLLLRLGVDADDQEQLGEDARRSITAFATACHLNIDWYARSRARQRRLYLLFGIFTGLLVVAIPVAVFLTANASEALAGQFGVIITGVLSAHRALASTLDKRNMERHFWKAQADLKSILYSFEDKWRDCVLAEADGEVTCTPEFLQDLQRCTRESEEVKNDEQEVFFSTRSSPFTGLADILGVAGDTSSSIMDSAQQRRRERVIKLTEVSEMEATLQALRGQRDKLEGEVTALKDATGEHDIARREAIESALDSLQRRIVTEEVDLAIARSKLGTS